MNPNATPFIPTNTMPTVTTLKQPSSNTIRYATGPSKDGSIGFTLKRKIYTHMTLQDFTPYKQHITSITEHTWKTTRTTQRITLQFFRLRDKESPIECYECERDDFCSDFCHCGPICENCGDKYCIGCGFHREDYY